ncbi:sensor histidine kinase N-terminal domain-containing protein [Salmonella enterica subsp. enterica]|nr:sensor histidine kinase N-terminal domain-containing protein [Salmonella enterica subsp. enterica]
MPPSARTVSGTAGGTTIWKLTCPVVLDSFELNMNDRLYYKVVDPSGKVISGYDDSAPAMPPATPYPVLSGAGVVLSYRVSRRAIRVARFATAGQRRRHYRHGGDLCRRGGVPSLSGGPTAVLFPIHRGCC